MIMKRYFLLLPVLAVFLLAISLALSGCKSTDEGKKPEEAAENTDLVNDPETAVETVDPSTLEGRGEKITMGLKFQKGDVFGYAITKTENLRSVQDTMNSAGEMVKFRFSNNTTSIRYDYKFEVKEELPEGAARIKATCLRVKFDGAFEDETGSREMAFDSDAENSRDKLKTFVQYNAPVNTPFEFIVDHEGNVRETLALDAITKRLLMDDYATTKLEARNMIQEQYSESMLKSIIQQAFQEIQDKPLSVDSSWKLVWSGQVGYMQVRNTSTYTLQGYKDEGNGRVAHVTAVLQSEYLGKKQFDTGQGMATVEKFNIGGRGASTFNIDTGKPLTRKMKQKLNVRFYIEPPEEAKLAAPDQVFDFYMTQNAIIENDVRPLQF